MSDSDPTDPARLDGATVPEGWQDIAGLCASVFADLEPIAARCTEAIRDAVPAYAGVAVAEGELYDSVVRNMAQVLVAIAEQRDPRPVEIAALRSLGGRRATQGMSVSDINEAFHIGYRHVWEELVQRSGSADEATRRKLLDAATTMWAWMHHVGDSLGSSHAAVTHDIAVRQAATRHRFLELLTSGPLDAEELHLLGASLGYSVGGRFQALVYERDAPVSETANVLQRTLAHVDGVQQVVARGSVITVLSQGAEADAVDGAIRAELPDVTGGIGSVRTGLPGARTSIGDAARAVAVAPAGESARFDDTWMWAVLADERDRLDDIVAAIDDVVRDHSDLAETVLGYAEAGFSPARAADGLFVHANTVSYRLRRWHELTGWDPRTFEGLARSVAAIRLRERP